MGRTDKAIRGSFLLKGVYLQNELLNVYAFAIEIVPAPHFPHGDMRLTFEPRLSPFPCTYHIGNALNISISLFAFYRFPLALSY